MTEDETIDTFTRKLTTLVNKAASIGHIIKDQTLVCKLLNAVLDRYLQLVASIEQYSDLSEMTMEEAIGRLKTYEETIKYKKGKQVDNQEKLMFTRHESIGKYFRGRGKHRFSQGKTYEKIKEERKDGESSHRNSNRNNFKKSSYDTSKLQCFQCKKIGHITPNCPQRTKANEQSNLVEEDELTLLMDDTWLWHARLGHLNFESLRSMAQRDLVHGILAIKHTTQVCDVCLIRKHSRWPFPKKAKARSTSPLDFIYGDLCGPITPPTPSGKKYIFLLVDDYSRYMWVYFLSTKDQAFDTFKEYKKSIENKLRTTLKMLRMDQEGEFASNEFTQYCKENDIARQLIAPYSPQQNGVVKRRNRTIMSTTRCMMKATNMPQNFWAKAIRHAIYILNSVRTKALEDITPYEAIKQRKPNLENLRVFGYIAYAKIRRERPENITPSEWINILSFGMILGTLPEPLKIGRTGQRARSYLDRDPGRLLAFEMRWSTRRSLTHSSWHTLLTRSSFGMRTGEEMRRLEAMGTYTDDEINHLARGGKQRGHIAGVGRVFPVRATASPSTPAHDSTLNSLHKKMDFMMSIFKSDSKYSDMFSQFESGGASGSGGCGDEEEGLRFGRFFSGKNSKKIWKSPAVQAVLKKCRLFPGDMSPGKVGLRQAPRAWNIKLDNTLKSLYFKKCALEQAIYTKTSKDSILLVGVYVDDLIITSTPNKEIDKFKAQMEEKFEMSDLGLLAYYLGIEATQTGGDILIKQSAYANKILKEAEMINYNETLIPIDPRTRLTKNTKGTFVNSTEYRSLVGCLRYLLHTRPDLSYFVGLLSRFMQEPKEQHMKAIKQGLSPGKESLTILPQRRIPGDKSPGKGTYHAFGDLIAVPRITDGMLDSLMALEDLDDVPGLPPLSAIEDMRYGNNTRNSTRADIERQKQKEIANARVRQVDSQGRAYGTVKRKCSIAHVWIEPGEGKFLKNDNQFDVYFPMLDQRVALLHPLTETKIFGLLDVNCTVKGGGVSGHYKTGQQISSVLL
nr:zinc finger, CCHC-type [Tanacetum cinerariifolium]